jgi:hypothetical protein
VNERVSCRSSRRWNRVRAVDAQVEVEVEVDWGGGKVGGNKGHVHLWSESLVASLIASSVRLMLTVNGHW